MKNLIKSFLCLSVFIFTSCSNQDVDKNIKMYSETWDETFEQGSLVLHRTIEIPYAEPVIEIPITIETDAEAGS